MRSITSQTLIGLATIDPQFKPPEKPFERGNFWPKEVRLVIPIISIPIK